MILVPRLRQLPAVIRATDASAGHVKAKQPTTIHTLHRALDAAVLTRSATQFQHCTNLLNQSSLLKLFPCENPRVLWEW